MVGPPWDPVAVGSLVGVAIDPEDLVDQAPFDLVAVVSSWAAEPHPLEMHPGVDLGVGPVVIQHPQVMVDPWGFGVGVHPFVGALDWDFALVHLEAFALVVALVAVVVAAAVVAVVVAFVELVLALEL